MKEFNNCVIIGENEEDAFDDLRQRERFYLDLHPYQNKIVSKDDYQRVANLFNVIIVTNLHIIIPGCRTPITNQEKIAKALDKLL